MKSKKTENINSQKTISVIIPAYKAEKFIVDNLIMVKRVLDQIRYPYEIICVVDGKVDRTFEEATKIASRYPRKIKVILMRVWI